MFGAVSGSFFLLLLDFILTHNVLRNFSHLSFSISGAEVLTSLGGKKNFEKC